MTDKINMLNSEETISIARAVFTEKFLILLNEALTDIIKRKKGNEINEIQSEILNLLDAKNLHLGDVTTVFSFCLVSSLSMKKDILDILQDVDDVLKKNNDISVS